MDFYGRAAAEANFRADFLMYAPSVLSIYAYRYAPTAPPSGSFGGSSTFGSLRTGEDGRSVRFLLSLALFTPLHAPYRSSHPRRWWHAGGLLGAAAGGVGQ